MNRPIGEAFERFIEAVEEALGHPVCQRSLETYRYAFFSGAEATLGESLMAGDMGEEESMDHLNAMAGELLNFFGANTRN